MKQARSFVSASDIYHQLNPNSKKRKRDKIAETQRGKTQNQNQAAWRGPNRSEGERKYPPWQDSTTTEETPSMPSEMNYLLPQQSDNIDLWGEYHKEHGHTLSNCRELKRILDQYADEGKLNHFLCRGSLGMRYNSNNRQYRKVEPEKKSETKDHSSTTNGVINMIVGGFSEEFPILWFARDSIQTLIKGPPKEHPTCPEMKFDEKLSISLQQPHTDPVVVTLKIGQMKARRVLVDTGSTTDLITMDCLR